MLLPTLIFQYTYDMESERLGVPAVATVTLIVLEFFGGIALILGFLVAIVAFFIALEMIENIALKKTKMKAPAVESLLVPSFHFSPVIMLIAPTMNGNFRANGMKTEFRV